MSDGPPTWDRRITRPRFRVCSRCPSHSQAPLCPYTQRTIANRAEGTFGRLRYSLGGNRPSQTAYLTLSPDWSSGLEFQHEKGGIPRVAPPNLAVEILRLPPILYIQHRNPMPSYSKGSGVFPSCRRYGASSPRPQFHRAPR